MTREQILDCLNWIGDEMIEKSGPMTKGEIADRILAAIAKEREGEIELCRGDMMGWSVRPLIESIEGKTGQLIFRPKGKGE